MRQCAKINAKVNTFPGTPTKRRGRGGRGAEAMKVDGRGDEREEWKEGHVEVQGKQELRLWG